MNQSPTLAREPERIAPLQIMEIEREIRSAPLARRADELDRLITAIGVIDQALQGLMRLDTLHELPELPRSHLLAIYHGQRQLSRATTPLAQLRGLGALGSCMLSLARDWSQTLRPESGRAARSRAARAYTIASLAAASVLIPWIMLRKRSAA